jgi:glycosyltransferase involved in cell wall biosynthesis
VAGFFHGQRLTTKDEPLVYPLRVLISVVIITRNEEANLGRTLESVKPLLADGDGEIVIVDSGSTDRTIDIATSFAARVFSEPWKGYAQQKNSALAKATGDWVLSLDGDEELEPALASEILCILREESSAAGLWIPRKNFFLGRWIRRGGYWPDPKLRLFRRGLGEFEDRLVHEDVRMTEGSTRTLKHAILHHSYPTMSDYIRHMNEYSSLGAEMAVAKGYRGMALLDIALRPVATFLYNYCFRLGFLDGREGFLLHVSHAVYVGWKYAKVWELKHVRQ